MTVRPLLITNARLVDPAAGTDTRGAVLIKDGLIADLGPNLQSAPDGTDTINAKGKVLAPGLVDMRALLDRFLENVMADELVRDGVVAASRAQAANLWKFREAMNEGQAQRGAHLRTDVSVSLSQLSSFVEQAETRLRAEFPDCLTLSYGHVGDGNVHINVIPPASADAVERDRVIHDAKDCINAVIDEFRGSISAEHGIGRLKRPEFEARISDPRRQLLTAIKRAIDPDGRLNPNCQIRCNA